MPPGRKELYAIYKACERFQIKPPEVKENWEDNNFQVQANLLAYNQIRDNEEIEILAASAGARI